MARFLSSGAGVQSSDLNAMGVLTPYVAPTLPKWSKARDSLRAGSTINPRIAFVGDSKTRGAGAGTSNSANQNLTGAAMKAKHYRLAQLLNQEGIPAHAETWFGAGGAGTIPDATAYDPRLSGFSGWNGSVPSLGGTSFVTSNSNPGQFTPGTPVDRVSIFFRNAADRPAFTVAKGSETVAVTPDGIYRLSRQEISFSTRDASPIIITRTGTTNSLLLIGLSAWDSTKPAVEVANFGVFGCNSAYQASTSDPLSPANALAIYAPHLTIINLGTNDLGQSVSLSSYIANITTIVQKAQLSGDVILCWPAVAGSQPSGGSDATRATWRAALKALASQLGCVFADEEALFGGRTGAQANGWFYDSLHESPAAYYSEANALVRLLVA